MYFAPAMSPIYPYQEYILYSTLAHTNWLISWYIEGTYASCTCLASRLAI